MGIGDILFVELYVRLRFQLEKYPMGIGDFDVSVLVGFNIMNMLEKYPMGIGDLIIYAHISPEYEKLEKYPMGIGDPCHRPFLKT